MVVSTDLDMLLVIETSSVPPRKSLIIFGKLRKMFGNTHLALGTILENLRKIVVIGMLI